MSMRTVLVASAMVAMAGGLAGFGQPDKPKSPTPAQPVQPGQKDKDKVPAQPSEQDAMKEAYKKAGTPGEAHKVLKAVEGRWNAKVVSANLETGKDETSDGTATNSWVLGNRFLRQEFKGSFMGEPFEGFGYWGYDNTKKEYVSSWYDSMSTGFMVSNGKYDAATRTFTLTGECADPLTGKNQKLREVIKITSENEHVMEMFGPGPDGKEMKMMTITYTRQGAASAPGTPKPPGR